jgi:hypothetical protein
MSKISRQLKILAAVLGMLLLAPSSFAQLTANNLDEHCKAYKPLTVRKTVILIDPNRVATSDKTWAAPLLSKLELVQREQVEVLAINWSTGAVTEVFKSCHPAFTEEEKKKIKGGLLSAGADKTEKELKRAFETKLRTALSKAAQPTTAAKTGDILNVLSNAAARFKDASSFHRIIIYSQMPSPVAKKAMGSKPADREQAYAKLFSTFTMKVGLSEFFVYGTTASLSETERQFWEDYFLSQGSILTAMSPNLQLEKSAGVSRIVRLEGKWSRTGTSDGQAAISIAVEKDGRSPLSIVSFFIGTGWVHVPVGGTFTCTKSDVCELKGQVLKNVPYGTSEPYFEAEIDKVQLSGSKTALSGKLETGRDLEVSDNAKSGYTLKFQK